MKIKNWKKFQHFKDRRPPWIRLYRDILDDYDIGMLSDRNFRFLIKLWLIASEDKKLKGNLPEPKALAWRLGISGDDLAEILRALGDLIECSQDDIDVLSVCQQSVTPETETETETDLSNLTVSTRDQVTSIGKAVGDRSPSPSYQLLAPVGDKTGTSISKSTKTTTKKRKTKASTAGSEAWDAYSAAYQNRYGIAPVRNAKSNALCKQLVERLGAEDAKGVAYYYPTTRNAFYVARRHSLECLVKDAEGIRTEWITGDQITQTRAMEEDRLAKTGNDWTEIIAERGEG